MYSLMSILIKDSSESNMLRANARANSVLPTPVGPKNMKVPMGFLGSFKPTLFRWMAFTTLLMASSWPMTIPFISSAIFLSLVVSASTIRFTGIPVIILTTSAIFSSLMGKRFVLLSSSHKVFAFSKASPNFFSVSLKLAASSKRWLLTTLFFSFLTSSICFSNSTISWGTLIFFKCTLAPTSSNTSMALSGNKRSVI